MLGSPAIFKNAGLNGVTVTVLVLMFEQLRQCCIFDMINIVIVTIIIYFHKTIITKLFLISSLEIHGYAYIAHIRYASLYITVIVNPRNSS